MYQAANDKPRYHAFLTALASDGTVLNELIGFLEYQRDAYKDNCQRAAVEALDSKDHIPYALRQAGAVMALNDIIFILNNYAKKQRSIS